MPSSDEAHLRYSSHYLQVLLEAAQTHETDAHAGLQAFDIDWLNIRAGYELASERASSAPAFAKLTVSYGTCRFDLFHLRLHPQQQISWLERPLQLAGERGDRSAEGVLQNNIGLALARLGRLKEAIARYNTALDTYEQSKNPGFEASVLNNLGTAHMHVGLISQAKHFYEKALTIDREFHNKRGLVVVRKTQNVESEGHALGNLGLAYCNLGNYTKAIDYCNQSLSIKRIIGDRVGEANSLGNLGKAYSGLGDASRAMCCYEQALIIFRDINYPHGEALVLNLLAVIYAQIGNLSRTIATLEESRDVAHQIGDLRGEAVAAFNLGVANYDIGNVSQAIRSAEFAERLFAEIASPEINTVRNRLFRWRLEVVFVKT
jgi:tetratricopeptide (TPR) repeat protein